MTGGTPDWVAIAAKFLMGSSFVLFLTMLAIYLFLSRQGAGVPKAALRPYRRALLQSAAMLVVVTATTFIIFSTP